MPAQQQQSSIPKSEFKWTIWYCCQPDVRLYMNLLFPFHFHYCSAPLHRNIAVVI